jgi:hypothetical protein
MMPLIRVELFDIGPIFLYNDFVQKMCDMMHGNGARCMKKIAFILPLLLYLALLCPSVALADTDEPSTWAIPFVERSSELELIPETFYGRFTEQITRAEFCAIAVRVFESIRDYTITESAFFYDTYDTNIYKMAGLGVVHGLGGNIFGPEREITREEAAVLLANFMWALGYPLPYSQPDFADLPIISEWAISEVGQVQAQGIMAGVSGNMFDPKGNLTIEQSIKTMLVIYDIVTELEEITVLEEEITLEEELELEEERLSVNDPEVAGRRIPILMYHAIADVPTTSLTSLFVRPAELEAQLKYIADNGYQTITFEDLDNIGIFSKPIMLTFDDGYKDNYTILFPLLEKYELKATIFVITNTVWSKGRLSIEDIVEMSDSGLVSIQSHTKNHRNLTTLGKETLAEELSSAKEYLEELTGKPVIALCYPEGHMNAAVRTEAAEYYRYAVLNGGGQFICGGNLMTMSRVRINRGVGMTGFAALIK